MRSWVYLYFPNLQLDQLLLTQAEGKHRPLVLYDESTLRLKQLNRAALDLGMQPGMPLSDAWLLSSELVAHRFQGPYEKQLTRQIALYLYRYFADIAISGGDGLWIEISSMQRLHQGQQESVRRLHKSLESLSLTYFMGRANSPLAASILAKADICLEQSDVNWQQVSQALQPLDIGYINLEPKTEQKLRRMGLTSIGKLLGMPTASLGRKLGYELVNCVAQLQGQQSVSLQYFRPAVHFHERMPLASEVTNWAGLRFPVNRLLLDLEHYLRVRQKVTRQLKLTLYTRDKQANRIQLALAQGTYRAQDFMSLCQLRLEREVLRQPILELALTVDNLEEWQPSSEKQLTDKNQSHARTNMSQLLNQLQTRLGEPRIRGLNITTSWLPELAQDMPTPGTLLSQGQQSWRPPWLLSNPVRVNIEEWQAVSQPERLQTHWWQSLDLQVNTRDYLLATDKCGCVGWLYFDYAAKQWLLQGWSS
ncbi:hypothetical protein CWE09_10300 [Aliidiomarina minuta]|uniref:UmuC domain-containing protein n=1 Tax=Aliidiomarina minuta TaxID=880057 RepID=A0A432WAK0_9GAMM|nr:DNA polymerase Y family protein [Aliidiomarina minuta]RUO27055.1 hypothetical protein CWE09_10300 [Aliidiomarina minuta]